MRLSDKLAIAFLALALLVLGWLGYSSLNAPVGHAVAAGDEIRTDLEPVQKQVTGVALPVREFGKKRVFLTALAEYQLSGVLASKHAYRLGVMDRLSPWDYAVAWGGVPQLFPWIKFSQSGRFCHYRYKPDAPVDATYLQNHMSNNHLIPANSNIRRALRLGKTGMKVCLEGYLVQVRANQKGRVVYSWDTSLVRTDTGFGACELIYVTQLRLGDTVYR